MNNTTRDIIINFVKNNKNIQKISGLDNIGLDDTFLKYMETFKYESRTSKDNFLKTEKNLLEWYKGKNPNFKNINEINFELPEFTILVQTIVLYLCKILYDGKFPGKRILKIYPIEENNINNLKNNSSYKLYNRKLNDKEVVEIIKILENIEKLGESREYKSITKIYLDFIKLVSGIYDEKYLDIYHTQRNLCIDFIDFIYKMFDTPFIMYPTFNQMDYKYILKTFSSPVVNFLISYTRFYSHDKFLSPCWHLNHDVMFHGYISHFSKLGQYTNSGIKYESYVNYIISMNFYLVRERKENDKDNNALLNIYNNIMEPLITHILYILESNIIMNDNIKRFLTIYFFIVLHEMPINLEMKYSDLSTYIELLRNSILTNKKFITNELNEEFDVPDDNIYLNYNYGLECFDRIFSFKNMKSNGGSRRRKYSKKTKKYYNSTY